MKNIIIYTHMPHFSLADGGTVVQYYLAKILEEYGQCVRIYTSSGIETPNSIFSKFYKNDFPIDNNSVVIYCEGTQGNPLQAKNVVRWMLSKLGQNVPYDWVNTWGQNELVYYFNSEEKIKNNQDKVGNIFKMLNILYIHPNAVNINPTPRHGTCFTIRKAKETHNGKKCRYVHNPSSFEITRNHTQEECINMFNKYKFFISYDSLTFLSVISALCGCISIVIKVDGLDKNGWLHTTAAADYLKASGETSLYGIAYGSDDVENAINTLNMAKEQWNRITQFSKDKYVTKIIEDVNNFENMTNTIKNNFY